MSDKLKFPQKITRTEALCILQAQLPVIDHDKSYVTDCSGRVAAHSVYSDTSLPFHDRSAMDGFAVAFADIKNAESTPVSLTYSGEVRPSGTDVLEKGEFQAVRVLTGGIIPNGTDTVIPFERTKVNGSSIKIYSSFQKGEFIRKSGADILKGEVIISENEVITPCQAALLAYAGIREIDVRRTPKIAVLAIGNELCDPAQKNTTGLIPADNLILLKSLCKTSSVENIKIAPCANSPQQICDAIQNHSDFDIIITTGGTGPGNRDFVFSSVIKAGGKPLFKGLAMHPAKSIFACKTAGAVVIGLPGPPNAVNLAFHTIINPVINIISGLPLPEPVTAILSDTVKGAAGREKLCLCRFSEIGGTILADPLVSRELSPRKVMSMSNAIITLPPDCGKLQAGEKISIIKFK